MKLGIIGGGRAAWAFGQAWRRGNHPIAGVSLRPGSSSELPRLLDASAVPIERVVRESDLLLVAVPDAAIPQVTLVIEPFLGEQSFRFHASGTLPGSVLGPGPRCFSLHPLAALPPAGTPASPPPLLVFEGPDASLDVARTIAATFGAPMSRIETSFKPLYHAGAVLGSNHVAALLEIASGVLRSAGIDETEGRRGIATLARSAIGNWENSPPVARFTGPVARGDRATVELHLQALGAVPGIEELYRRLSLEVAEAVEKTGQRPPEIAEIIDLLRKWQVS